MQARHVRQTKPQRRKREIRTDGKIRSTIYWGPTIQNWAQKLAARERRSVNWWINNMVEQAWKSLAVTEQIHNEKFTKKEVRELLKEAK